MSAVVFSQNYTFTYIAGSSSSTLCVCEREKVGACVCEREKEERDFEWSMSQTSFK